MNGVYSLDFETGHAMGSFRCFWELPSDSFRSTRPSIATGFPRWIAGYGVLVAILLLGRYLLMYVTADPLFIAEWILIYAAFVWIFLVTIDAFRRECCRTGSNEVQKHTSGTRQEIHFDGLSPPSADYSCPR